jgi:hypothetical protein
MSTHSLMANLIILEAVQPSGVSQWTSWMCTKPSKSSESSSLLHMFFETEFMVPSSVSISLNEHGGLYHVFLICYETHGTTAIKESKSSSAECSRDDMIQHNRYSNFVSSIS